MNINGRYDGANIVVKARCPVTPAATIFDIGGAGIVLDQYTLLGTPAKLDISSSSTNDIAATGTGTRTLLVLGLGATGQFQTEAISLNGQAIVQTVNTWTRFFFARQLTAGSLLWNDGDIYIVKTGTGGTYTSGVPGTFTIASALAKIPANSTGGGNAWYTTPQDSRPANTKPDLSWRADQIDVSISSAAAGGLILLVARDIANAEAPIREEAFYLPTTGGTFSYDLKKYELQYGPNTDLRVQALTNSAGSVSAALMINKMNY